MGIPDNGGVGVRLVRDSSGVSRSSTGDPIRLNGNFGEVGEEAKRGILDTDLISIGVDG